MAVVVRVAEATWETVRVLVGVVVPVLLALCVALAELNASGHLWGEVALILGVYALGVLIMLFGLRK